MVSRREMVVELLKQYRRNPDQFSDRQAEKIAKMAQEAGVHFPRESKFGRKLAFDFADTALLGLLPNEWRPTSRGESVFGETSQDKWAGRLGWLGAVPTAGAGIAGRGAIWAGAKGLGKAGLNVGAKGAGLASRAGSQAMARARQFDPVPYMEGFGEGVGRVRQAWSSAGDVYRGVRVKGVSALNKGKNSAVVNNARNVRDAFYTGMGRTYPARSRWRPTQYPYSLISDRPVDSSLLNTVANAQQSLF